MIRTALAFGALLAATVAHAAPARVPVGDLTLAYDDADWRVSAWPNGVRLEAVGCPSFRCEDGTGVTITAGPIDGPLPDAIHRSETGFVKPLWELLDGPTSWPGSGVIREINGFAVYATDRWSGCRAASPSELRAVLDHAGRRYTLESGIAAACGGVWGVGREAFVSILEGLRPAP